MPMLAGYAGIGLLFVGGMGGGLPVGLVWYGVVGATTAADARPWAIRGPATVAPPRRAPARCTARRRARREHLFAQLAAAAPIAVENWRSHLQQAVAMVIGGVRTIIEGGLYVAILVFVAFLFLRRPGSDDDATDDDSDGRSP